MIKGGIKAAACVLALLLWGTAQAGTVTYVYSDPQGTPLAEADAQGNITATFDYRPYGTQALGQPPSGPGYTGHVNDPDTGFVYMQARYYDPEVGRFLSVDPVAPAAGSYRGFNRYTYAYNNPARYTDPDGRCPWCIGAVVGAVTGAAIGASTSYVSSGGSWRAAFAGGVGGAVGGAITGGTLGAGTEIGLTVAAGITAGIAGESTSETVGNVIKHGSDLKSYEYSPGKIAVAGMTGAVGATNAQLAGQLVLKTSEKAVLSQAIVTPVQLAADQVVDHAGHLPGESPPPPPETEQKSKPAPPSPTIDHLELH